MCRALDNAQLAFGGAQKDILQFMQIMELVVVTSWPGSHMRSIPPQVFPATPFAIDSVPGHPTGKARALEVQSSIGPGRA